MDDNLQEKYDFTMMSVNIRGLNDRRKRRNVFRYLKKNKIDVCLLQETYSTPDVERIWKNEWAGQMFCSHGTKHSRGVMLLIRPGFDAKVKDIYAENTGRLMIADLEIQETLFKAINIYAPNAEENQVHYYRYLRNIMVKKMDTDDRILLGGDFNFIINPSLDRKGGSAIQLNSNRNQIIKTLDDIKDNLDIMDIWRVKNPHKHRFTWHRKLPYVKSRLDYWFVSSAIADYVENADIVAFIGTDHSAITLKLKGFKGRSKGRGNWRLNTSFLEEQPYVEELIENKKKWLNEIEKEPDARIRWEWLKYRIRQYSMEYGKAKAKRIKNTESDLEQQLNQLLSEQDQANTISVEEHLENQIVNIRSKLEEISEYKTNGLMLRSQATWYEKGEKSTKYFLQLESRNRVKKCVNKLKREDDTITTDSEEILNMQANFYEKLYAARDIKTTDQVNNYLASVDTPTLSTTEREQCEGLLTFNECSVILKTFKTNKAPGNDGIPIEFYRKFFPLFGQCMVASFNKSWEQGELTVSQRQAVITLLDKGKDRTLLKNWRPISLLNVDYKIASKAVANRFLSFLPKLIHCNQAGYVKGRNIADNIRAIEDIVKYLKDCERPGVLINIDFEKAFDSLNWTFLLSTLAKFNFGPSFIKWIQTFYTNVSSCIINNGFTSPYFPVQRGVRQGDPLSPYLFILMVEIMSSKIRQERTITGIKLGESTELKLLQYADDTNGLLSDIQSAKIFLRVVKEFGSFSGLMLNVDKTEGMWLGCNRTNQGKPLGIVWPDKPLRILGVYVSYDKEACYQLNFESRIFKAKRIIHMWSSRNLTIFGRIQIVKTFVQSQFLYVSSVIETPVKAMKQINQLIFKFIWKNKRERLKRTVLVKSITNGGLQVPDFESMVNTAKIKWIKKLVGPDELISKTVIQTYLQKYGIDLNVLLYSNFNVQTLRNLKCLPTFYLDMLKLWSKVGNGTRIDKENLIWYNRNICKNGQSFLYRNFFEAGLWYITDLFEDDQHTIIVPFSVWVSRGVGKQNVIKWMGLVNTCKVQRLIGTNVMEPVGDEPNQISLFSEIPIMSNCNNKNIYLKLLIKKTGDLIQVPRISKYLEDTVDINWSEVYTRGNIVPIDTKTKDFQYKFIQDLLSNRYWLHKWKIVDSPICLYCKSEIETIEHMFWECSNIQEFWKGFHDFWEKKGLWINATKLNVFLGDSNNFVCTLIFSAKLFIYNKKIHEEQVSLAGHIQCVKQQKRIEYQMAKEKNRVDEWVEKWSVLQDE